jgi:hypothetical protein
MKVLFQNRTPHTAYIAIVDYDETTKYISNPIIFELESRQACLYETTTPKYFFSGMIDGHCNSYDRTLNDNKQEMYMYSMDSHHWTILSPFMFYLDDYLMRNPDIKSATICTNDTLKDYTLTALSKHYNAYYNGMKTKRACN